MKIFVTGGAGYIGSVLVPALLADGHSVSVLDSFMYGPGLLDVAHDEKLSIVRGDARDEGLLQKLAAGADVLIPLACLTGAPLCDRDPLAAKTIVFDAVKSLLKIRTKDQRVLYPTTNSGYGVGAKDGLCDESSPLNPVSLYGRLKNDAEKAVLDAGNAVTFRLATAFGASPRMRLDLLVNDFTYRAVHDRFIVLFESSFRRNFIHVRDIAGAFLHALNARQDVSDGPYNVGLSDANLSKLQLCEKIQEVVPEFTFLDSPIGSDPDKRDYLVSNEKLEKTGWRPKHSLESGIRELVKVYQGLKRSQYANV